jgi:hypothetical protein
MSLRQLLRPRPEVDDPVLPGGLSGKHTVESGPAVRLNLGIETMVDFEI